MEESVTPTLTATVAALTQFEQMVDKELVGLVS